MTILEFTAVAATGSFVAGFLGAITGLGGGVVIVPLLTIALGVDIRYAIGASLVSVIATSSGAAAAYVKEGFTNVARVAFLAYIFARQQDKLYTAVALIVLALLAYSLFGQ